MYVMESASDRLRRNLDSRRVRAGPIGNLIPDVLRLIYDEVERAGREGRRKLRLYIKRFYIVLYWTRELVTQPRKVYTLMSILQRLEENVN